MKFTKMQGIGNDYVYVNAFEEKIVLKRLWKIPAGRQRWSATAISESDRTD